MSRDPRILKLFVSPSWEHVFSSLLLFYLPLGGWFPCRLLSTTFTISTALSIVILFSVLVVAWLGFTSHNIKGNITSSNKQAMSFHSVLIRPITDNTVIFICRKRLYQRSTIHECTLHFVNLLNKCITWTSEIIECLLELTAGASQIL